MVTLESLAVPDVLYLTLMAGLWLSALAVVTPGTGVLELLAFLSLAATGFGTLLVPINAWGLLGLLVGLALFVMALRGRRSEAWLALSALALSLSSVFLFGLEGGAPAVNPVLASVVSLLTLGYFWIAVRKSIVAQRARPLHNPAAVVGLVGEARTPIDPTGSVYVGGELWTARARAAIPAGARVRVREKEGLTLTVEPDGSDSGPSSVRGG